MAISILAKYKSIRKEKLSDTARDVLDKMAEATNNFKDYTATKKLRPKFEAFYDKIKASKPEALKGYKAPKAAASKKAEPKKRLNRFKAALERRKSQGGVPKVMDDVKIDAKRPAISIKGKRISKNGKTYYEYRDNRYDARPQKYPKLADGGQLPIEDSKLVGKKITIKLPNEPEAIHDTVTMEYNDFVVGKKGVWSKENIVTKHEHGGYMADGGMMAKGGELGNFRFKKGDVVYAFQHASDKNGKLIKNINPKYVVGDEKQHNLQKWAKVEIVEQWSDEKYWETYKAKLIDGDYDGFDGKVKKGEVFVVNQGQLSKSNKRPISIDYMEEIIKAEKEDGYMAHGGMMAKGGHLGEPHKLDEFENGGEIAEQNTQMLMSLNHQIEHHAREIGEILNDETPVMAWVLAKAERAASDLSDIAHFLDGQSVSDAE